MPANILPLSFNGDNQFQLSYTLERFLEYAITLAKKDVVNFCYIGTASQDSAIEDLFFTGFSYLKFNNFSLSLTVSKLSLTINLSHEQIENKIRQQDIIFIGGGDTEFMLQNWKEKGFETILNKLNNENCLPIIMGLSAGGMFPFAGAISLTNDKREYKALTPGYNWIPVSFCPHSNAKDLAICTFDPDKQHDRLSAYETAINLGVIPPGYAIPDDCMLHFYGDKLLGIFSTRENIKCLNIQPNAVQEITPVFLKKENSSKFAQKKLKELHLEAVPEPAPIQANRCNIV